MPKQTELFLTRNYNHNAVTFLPADTAIKTLYAAGVDDSRIISIFITSTDSIANDLLYYLSNGTTDFQIGHVDIPVAAGTDGTSKHVDGLDVTTMPGLIVDSNNNAFLPLKTSWLLRGKMRVAPAAGTVVTIAVTAEDY